MDKKKSLLNEANRLRLDNLVLGKQEKPDKDWYPTMSDIKSLDPNDDDDVEFMYWIYVHGEAATEKQNEVRDYIFERIKGKYDVLNEEE